MDSKIENPTPTDLSRFERFELAILRAPKGSVNEAAVVRWRHND